MAWRGRAVSYAMWRRELRGAEKIICTQCSFASTPASYHAAMDPNRDARRTLRRPGPRSPRSVALVFRSGFRAVGSYSRRSRRPTHVTSACLEPKAQRAARNRISTRAHRTSYTQPRGRRSRAPLSRGAEGNSTRAWKVSFINHRIRRRSPPRNHSHPHRTRRPPPPLRQSS